jgi:peptidyl-prolyl cis-trans isomerase SurA
LRLHWSGVVFLALSCLPSAAEVIDRVAVVVGRRVIKASDIDRELRVASFLNRKPLDESPAAERAAAERLIDQELVRTDLVSGQYSQPSDQDVNKLLEQLKRDRFGSSDARLRSELERYGLTETQLRRHLLWQLTVLRFIDQRFRSGVVVTDDEAAVYYREHTAELQRAYPRNHTLQDLDAKIKDTIAGERINQAFEEWLAEARRGTRIGYRQQAFAGGTSR